MHCCVARARTPRLKEWCAADETALEDLRRRLENASGGVDAKRILQLDRDLLRRQRALAKTAASLAMKKTQEIWGGRGRYDGADERQMIVMLIKHAVAAGARRYAACAQLRQSRRSIKRWCGADPADPGGA